MARSNCFFLGCIGFVLWMSYGCAFDLAHIKFDPVQIRGEAEASKSFTIQEDVHLTGLPCGYSRNLSKNSKWNCVGTINQGQVYKPVSTCFTLECSNVYEAYLVVRDNNLMGFYLPVEKGFNSLKKPIPLPLSR